MQYFPKPLEAGTPSPDEPAVGQGANPVAPSDAGRAETAGLPPPWAKRWSPETKAKVVFAVREGILTFDEARERYALSVEEFLAWQYGLDLFGIAGLQVNKLQQIRNVTTRCNNFRPERKRPSNDAFVRRQPGYGRES